MDIIQRFLPHSRFVRTKRKLDSVSGIVIHEAVNPSFTAEEEYEFYMSRIKAHKHLSIHFIIGFDGKIIQCIPEDEVAIHSSTRIYTVEALRRLNQVPNFNTLGIECCIKTKYGNMTEETYNSLVKLAASLLKKYKLKVKDLWLHNDIDMWVNCHRWFINHPDEWEKFKVDVKGSM